MYLWAFQRETQMFLRVLKLGGNPGEVAYFTSQMAKDWSN